MIELLIVIVIISIMAAITFSTYEALMYRNRVTNISASFYQTLRFARNEAMRRNHCVMVCDLIPNANATGGTCWNNRPNWMESGYSVFAIPACTVPNGTSSFPVDFVSEKNLLRTTPPGEADQHGIYGLVESQQYVNANTGLKTTSDRNNQAGYVMFNAKGQLTNYTSGIVFQAFGSNAVATDVNTQPSANVDKKICVFTGGDITLIDINQQCAN